MGATLTPPIRLISRLVQDDPEMADIVTEFVEAIPARIESLREAWREQSWDRLKTLAHQLKGAGGSYGYPDITTLGAAMEQGFKARQAQEFDRWIEELDALMKAARAGLA